MEKVIWIEGLYKPIGNNNEKINNINKELKDIKLKLGQIKSLNFSVENEILKISLN